MLLNPAIPQSPLKHHSAKSISISRHFSIAFQSLNPPPIRSIKTPKIQCSISQDFNYNTVDYEKKAPVNWLSLYKRISLMADPSKGSVSVLNQWENEGRMVTKWDLSRIVKELRKYKNYKFALQVYDWMNNRGERFRITTSDIAIQLDLVAKVHGIPSAEAYFKKVPDSSKESRIYGALLNVYARARMTEKAESIFSQIIEKGYADQALTYNVMMTLYLKLKDYDKIDSIITEMIKNGIRLDIYSYNIWLSSCGSQGSVEKLERVYGEMKLDKTINPNWSTYSTMATMFVRMDEIEKAEECLKLMESIIVGRDRIPYHHLISIYGSIGNKDEILRIWNVYKRSFPSIPNLGYHALISALIRSGDIVEAEKIYSEWLDIRASFDPRITNLLMSWYSSKGLSKKVDAIFQEMEARGGKPNANTLEILAEGHIRGGRINDAVSCLKDASLVKGAENWKPKPVNASTILKACDQENDVNNKEALLELLKRLGCFDNKGYMSCLPMLNPTADNERLIDGDDDDGNAVVFG